MHYSLQFPVVCVTIWFCAVFLICICLGVTAYNTVVGALLTLLSLLFSWPVSRYQSVGSKKAIIRLEQGARSFMNRAILSHGAFAVFYGRSMKYFIRSPEVFTQPGILIFMDSAFIAFWFYQFN